MLLFKNINRFLCRQQSILCLVKHSFSHSKAMYVKYIKYDNQFKTLMSGKKLRPVTEAATIQDWEDKFGLEKIQNPKVVLQHIEASDYSYPLNDLIYFLRKLVELQHTNQSGEDFRESSAFKRLVDTVKTRLKNDDHEKFPYLGSYAHSFMKLNVQDQELWQLLEYKVNEDQWYTNFNESVLACEGFTMLTQFKSQDRLDEIYKKIERIIGLTVWEVNMVYYKRIVEALVEVNRFTPEIFAKMEQHILSNLSMDYELPTMVDILFAFAKSGNGSKRFYDSMQLILYKGHMFNRNVFLEGRLELPFQGRIVSKLLEIYSKALKDHEHYVLHPDFRAMMYKMLVNKKTKYELTDIVETFRYLPNFQYEEQKEIETSLFQKVLQNDENYRMQIMEIIEFMEFFGQSYANVVPKAVHKHIMEKYIQNFSGEKSEVILFSYSYMLQNGFLDNQPDIQKLMMQYLDSKLMNLQPQVIEGFLQVIDQHIDRMVQTKQLLGDNMAELKTQTKKVKDYLLVCKFQSIHQKNLIENKLKEQQKAIPSSKRVEYNPELLEQQNF